MRASETNATEFHSARGHPVSRELLAKSALLREPDEERKITQYCFDQIDIYLDALDAELRGSVGFSRAIFYAAALVNLCSGGSFESELSWDSIEHRHIFYLCTTMTILQAPDVTLALEIGTKSAARKIAPLEDMEPGWRLSRMARSKEASVKSICAKPIEFLYRLTEKREVILSQIHERTEHLHEFYSLSGGENSG